MIAPFLAALSIAAAFIQVSVPAHWWPLDLPLLVTAFAGLSRGRGWGLACGVLAGFSLDTLLGSPPGLRLAPLAFAGALADTLQTGVNRDQPRLQVFAVLALTLAHDALLSLFARRFGTPEYGLRRVLFEYEMPRLAAQAVACLPLFWALGLVVRQRVFLDPRQRRVKLIRRWP
ncbi:MAG: rod shape-determining protein MreD [bacterium]